MYKDSGIPPTAGEDGDMFAWIGALEPGASKTIAFTVTYDSQGAYKLWAQVDTHAFVDEYDEGNNVSEPVNVNIVAPTPTPTPTPSPTPMPDLRISAVTPDPIIGWPGQVVRVAVTIENVGDSLAGGFWVDLYRDRESAPTSGEGGNEFTFIDFLEPGESEMISFTTSYASVGSYQLWAQVDTDDSVDESNEANNTYGPVLVSVPSPPVIVANARINQEPLIAYANPVTDTEFVIHLIKHDGSPFDPGDLINIQWISAAITGEAGRIPKTTDGEIDDGTNQAVQILEYAEHDNAELAYFSRVFDSTPVVVNNAHASDNEAYIACPWNIVPIRFQPLFSDHFGVQMPQAQLQTVAIGKGITNSQKFGNDYVIQVGRASCRHGDFIHFPVAFDEAPVVIANAWDGTLPVIASAWGNSTTGFFISLRDHKGQRVAFDNPDGVTSAAVQWIAVGVRTSE